MRILIAGAGIGGLALAALLRQRGVMAELVERATDFQQSGYNLGLYPMGTRVLSALGLVGEFQKISQPMLTYRICNGHGETMNSFHLAEMLEPFGYQGGLMRGELLQLLRSKCADVPLHFGTRLVGFEQRGNEVVASLSDGTERVCDLLVGADGIHSTVRRCLFGEHPDHSTGWGCWVWIVRGASRPAGEVTEYWGAGRLLGVYPIREGLGVIAAGPDKRIGPDVAGSDSKAVKAYFGELGGVDDLLQHLPDDLTGLFYWRLTDFRSEHWIQGRVALLGDSACAFLPTAGVGASMALESAAVLNDELSRTDAKYLGQALAHYEKRRKHRAEGVQDDSRRLASMMTLDSIPLAWGRDQLMKFYTLEMLVKNIAKSLEEPI